jgi:basic membrane protein A
MVKRCDTAIYTALERVTAGDSTTPVHLGLADDGVDISYSGGFLEDLRPQLESLRDAIVNGHVRVPCHPADRQAAGTDSAPTCTP